MIKELPFDLPGHIYTSTMPFGLYDPKGEVFSAYQAAGVAAVVVLSSQEEMISKTKQDLLAFYARNGLQTIYLPITDFSTPDVVALNTALEEVIYIAKNGQNVVIHCSAGIGRTGTFAACLAKQVFAISGEEAIRWVRKYIPAAVETPDQMRFVYDFNEEG